jgi:phytoene dehydrogenase-like protein
VELVNGERHEAEYVISAADGYATIFEMLKGWYIDEKLLKFYKKARTFPSLVFIALGVRKEFAGLPGLMAFPAIKPVFIDPQTTAANLMVGIHHYDPTLAPKGATLLTVWYETDNHAYWSSLHHDNPGQYNLEKERIAKETIDLLDQRFGHVKENVEMVDVSTPETFKRYTGNWKGSYEGWLMTPETGFKTLPHTLPGLKNFYMCGHWVAVGGGLPGVLLSGRETAQAICREDRKRFTIVYPDKKQKVVHKEEILNLI